MSVDIKYDQNRKVLDVSISGIPGLDELSSALENIINSGDYAPDIKVIWVVFNSLYFMTMARNIHFLSARFRSNFLIIIILSDLINYK